MKNIEEYPDFNPKNNLNSSSFVKDNLYRLSQLFDVDEDLTWDEKEKILINYITKHPESIKSFNLIFPQRGISISAPKVTNIGGLVKYQ